MCSSLWVQRANVKFYVSFDILYDSTANDQRTSADRMRFYRHFATSELFVRSKNETLGACAGACVRAPQYTRHGHKQMVILYSWCVSVYVNGFYRSIYLYYGRRSNGKSDNGLCSPYQRAKNWNERLCNVMWPWPCAMTLFLFDYNCANGEEKTTTKNANYSNACFPPNLKMYLETISLYLAGDICTNETQKRRRVERQRIRTSSNVHSQQTLNNKWFF